MPHSAWDLCFASPWHASPRFVGDETFLVADQSGSVTASPHHHPAPFIQAAAPAVGSDWGFVAPGLSLLLPCSSPAWLVHESDSLGTAPTTQCSRASLASDMPRALFPECVRVQEFLFLLQPPGPVEVTPFAQCPNDAHSPIEPPEYAGTRPARSVPLVHLLSCLAPGKAALQACRTHP